MNTFRRRLLPAMSLLLLCLSIAACGGNATSTAGSTPGALTTVTVCEAGKSLAFFPEYIAEQEGYFKAQGLNVPAATQVPTGTKAAAAIESGSCTIANGVILDAFTLEKHDSSVRVIGSLLNAYAVDIIVSKKFEKETGVSASSSLADKIKILKGKTIGITGPNTGTAGLLTYLFKLEGMSPTKDATPVSLGANNTAALAALQSGRVDALSFFSPLGQAVEAKGIGDILISPMRGDIPQLQGEVQGIFYTKQSVIDSQPQVVAGYIRAISQAETFFHNNPAQAKLLLTKFLGLGTAVTNAVYTIGVPDVAQNPQISQASYTTAGQFHLQAGLITSFPPFSTLVATSTINSALAKS